LLFGSFSEDMSTCGIPGRCRHGREHLETLLVYSSSIIVQEQ
jgi:hypothetical protein